MTAPQVGPASQDLLHDVFDRDIRPFLQAHAGDVDFDFDLDSGVVNVRFEAACKACHLRPLTFFGLVEKRLMSVEGVTDVRCDQVRVSSATRERIQSLPMPTVFA